VVTGSFTAVETLVAFRAAVRVDACARWRGAVGAAVVVSPTDAGSGMQTIDCAGAIAADAFDENTQTFWATLSTEGAAMLPRPIVPADFLLPTGLLRLPDQDRRQVLGLVEICTNHNGKSMMSKPYVCGACFGFSSW
jgi:hypothetical protein